uniref:Peroxisomal biogenesis factor 3 n=1 Tax=Ceratitis capitata TaxID=7213 RepID=W8CAC8_CERCA
MLGGLRDFVVRHRRKFIVTGVLVGGSYIAIKYAQRKLIEFQTRQARDFLEKSRRMQHFETTESTCNKVILGMGTELYAAILRECNADALLEQLRQNPSNKVELWEEMKIVAFTRLTTFVYASTMLVIALRAQINLLGGYLYQDVTLEKKEISEDLKQRYLSLIGNFIHEGGLSELIQLIRSKVIAMMKTVPLTKPFNLADIEQLFWSLQISISSEKDDPIKNMVRFLLPMEVPEYNRLLDIMFSDTLDVLDNVEAITVCANNVSRGFSLAVDAIAEGIFQSQHETNAEINKKGMNKSGDGDASAAAVNSMLKLNKVEIPLAKLIPIISGLTSKGFDEKSRPQNLATSLLTFYMIEEKTKVFGANIYEVFSSK